jgi:hypothetical protein
MNPDKDILLAEIIKEADRINEDSEHSAKSHFEAARIWGNFNLCIGVPATILAAAAGISKIPNYNTLFAIIAAILAGLMTFLNPTGKATKHHNAGTQYNALRNDTRIFINITCRDQIGIEETRKQLEKLNRRRNTLNTKSPRIPRWAYLIGKKRIREGEAKYRIDS